MPIPFDGTRNEKAYFALSAPTVLFSGGAAKTYHTFQPCHETEIQEINLGGYKYWSYYTTGAATFPYEVHLARSNSLVSGWVDYGKVHDGRWPSVYYDGNTFHMLHKVGATDAYTIQYSTSTDGITWLIQNENVCAGNNPFLWKNPNDSQWYLFVHDKESPGHRIKYRKAETIAGLSSASESVILTSSTVVASPSVFFRNGIYWLTVETYPGSVWNTEAYWSKSINGPFLQTTDSPILINQDACAMQVMSGNTMYLYYSEQTDVPLNYWDIVLRTVSL